MNIFLSFVLLIAGLVLLVKGADFLVDGASSLAKRLSVREIVIGLTIVAFGTSAPELIINIFSSAGGNNEIVFGNIIGSNLFNLMLILGIVGLIKPLEVQKNTVWKEIPFSLLAVVVLFVIVNDTLISGLDKNVLTRGDGIILLSFLIIFLVYTFFISKVESSDEPEIKAHKIPKSLLFIGLGFVGLFAGGKLVVDNAVSIARFFSVSDKLIALTVVSAGTSLPELITSIVAVRKGNMDLAVGNVVGSNIFNIFSILGISSVINPVEYQPILNIDVYILTVASIFLFVFMFTGKVRKLDRWEAMIFLIGYLGYTAYILIRR